VPVAVRQHRNMPPRLPRRSRTKAGEWGGAGGDKDFAPDGAVDRRDEPTATRLQPSAQRWCDGGRAQAPTLGERAE